MQRLIGLFLLAGVCVAPAMAQLPDRPNFYQSDMIMKNACSKVELGRLQKEVVAAAGGKAAHEAWALAAKMLCGQSEEARKYVLERTANPFKVRDGGDEEGAAVRKAKASSLKLVQMEAWDTSVVPTENGVSVMYSSGDVCVASFEMAEVKGKWKIVATGEACD